MQTSFDLKTTTAIVVANMIGTGVFATLGMQLELLKSGQLILISWLLGGIVALTGAISYGRLSAMIPKSGGEYTYLSVLYSPVIGFAAGVVSIVAGFSAPLALTAITFGYYLENVVSTNPTLLATFLILLLTAIHTINVRKGGKFHLWITGMKILVIVCFSIYVLVFNDSTTAIFSNLSAGQAFSGNFATSMLYVSFAYSGWNAACYVTEEVTNAKVNLISALLLGTGVVTTLYLLINLALLLTISTETVGSIDVVHDSSTRLWGPDRAKILDLLISVMLISSASSLVIAGPRVMMKMSDSFHVMKKFGLHRLSHAVILQSLLAFGLLVSFSFKHILHYTGLALSIFTVATVIGLLRHYPKPERSSERALQEVSALVFIAVNLWIIISVVLEQWLESLVSIIIIATISLIYSFWVRKKEIPL